MNIQTNRHNETGAFGRSGKTVFVPCFQNGDIEPINRASAVPLSAAADLRIFQRSYGRGCVIPKWTIKRCALYADRLSQGAPGANT